jgi:hypothetical protein
MMKFNQRDLSMEWDLVGSKKSLAVGRRMVMHMMLFLKF